MRICTYNVNSIRSRAELLVSWLQKRETDIDILCLQELKLTEDKFPRLELEKLGYHLEIFSQNRYNGVAVCSKEIPSGVRYGFGDPCLDEQKRFISCTFASVTVLNVYAPHGDFAGTEKYAYKQDWYTYFLDYLRTHYQPSAPLILLGDLNIAYDDHDVYDAKLLAGAIGTMPEEREYLHELLAWGFTDTFRYCHPHEQAFSWWSYMGGDIWNNRGMRIDYILCTDVLIHKLVSVETDMWPRRRRVPVPSDHAPVIASFSGF